MAGHSQFKNIMHRKGAQDAKRAKLFNKIAREITVAARHGAPDPAMNPRLRAAIADARANNMPRDRIDRAIKSASPDSNDAANYEEVRYEGYGPGGCALIIEALTDNRNRTAAELRTALSKNGGTLGETNSVSFQFNHVGEMAWPRSAASAEKMLEAVIDAGGEDVVSTDEEHIVTCSIDDFGAVRQRLESHFGEPRHAKLTWHPQSSVKVSGDDADSLLKLLDALNDNDDVQDVAGNFDLDEQ